jgi:hypothetical protein
VSPSRVYRYGGGLVDRADGPLLALPGRPDFRVDFGGGSGGGCWREGGGGPPRRADGGSALRTSYGQ